MLNQTDIDYLGRQVSFVGKLSREDGELLFANAVSMEYRRGDTVQGSNDECLGLVIVVSGQLRAYCISEQGREITLYRMLDGDVCIMTMSCLLRNITFDTAIEAEKDTRVLIVPAPLFHDLSERSMSVKEFTLEQLSARFSDVMWTMEQVVFKGMAERIMNFLEEESALEGGDTLRITHETIAKHLGTAREVVSRLLKYLESDGVISQSRGEIIILDRRKLHGR